MAVRKAVVGLAATSSRSRASLSASWAAANRAAFRTRRSARACSWRASAAAAWRASRVRFKAAASRAFTSSSWRACNAASTALLSSAGGLSSGCSGEVSGSTSARTSLESLEVSAAVGRAGQLCLATASPPVSSRAADTNAAARHRRAVDRLERLRNPCLLTSRRVAGDPRTAHPNAKTRRGPWPGNVADDGYCGACHCPISLLRGAPCEDLPLLRCSRLYYSYPLGAPPVWRLARPPA